MNQEISYYLFQDGSIFDNLSTFHRTFYHYSISLTPQSSIYISNRDIFAALNNTAYICIIFSSNKIYVRFNHI